jgi:hypothetical protein
MSRRERSRWGEEGRAESTAGAWAAAAVVLALGALGFGVASQMQVQDLEHRVDSLERTSRFPATTAGAAGAAVATTTAPAAGGSSGAAVLPGADRSAVEGAYQVVYDGSRPIEDRIRYIDDPTGIVASFQTLTSGELASTAAQLRAVVDQVTFTSTMTATVSYRLASGGTSGGDERIGSARLVGDTWKVTRSTVCGDLEDAGAPCSA